VEGAAQVKRRWVLATVLALAWLFAVVAFYYVAHKPFTATHLRALGQALAGLGGALLVVALGTGIGVRLLRGLTVARADRLILAAAVGLGVLSLVGLGLGIVGLLRPWVLWLLTVVGLLLTSGAPWRRPGPILPGGHRGDSRDFWPSIVGSCWRLPCFGRLRRLLPGML
jgi:hypothetical protein